MSIIKHVTLQKIVAHDFRYNPRKMVYGHPKQTAHLTVLPPSNYVLSVWRVGKARDVVEVALLFHDVCFTLPLPYQQLSQANTAQGHPVSSAV